MHLSETYNLFMAYGGTQSLQEKHRVEHYKPSLFRLIPHKSEKAARKNRFLWWILTRGRYTVYYVISDGKVVHHTYLIPKNYRFPFLEKNEFVILSSATDENYRGRGILPCVLNAIRNDYPQDTKFYSTISKHNAASIRAFQKAGFSLVGSAQHNENTVWTFDINIEATK